MSIISEQIQQLRDLADNPDIDIYGINKFTDACKQAADTIETLSVKLTSANMERSIDFGDEGCHWSVDHYGYLEWDKYSDGRGGSSSYKVIAWRPLPLLYVKKKEDEKCVKKKDGCCHPESEEIMKKISKVTICEKRKIITFHNREKAMQHYKDRWLFAWNDEDRINTRRIYETIRDTETSKIEDTYGKEHMILRIFSKNRDKECRRAFRLGTNEVLIVEKKYKGAGNWYELTLVDGTTDDDGRFYTDGTHLITRLSDVYQNDFTKSIHELLFYDKKLAY